MVEFRILGSMEVLDGDRRVDLPSGRARALLAFLVLHVGDVVSSERLIDELWGENPPPTAGTVVQGLVSRLRKVIEPGRSKGEPAALLQTVGPGYRLAVDPDAVDANRFKRLLDEARRSTASMRSEMLGSALGLWRGQALADFTYEPFAQRAIHALEELRLAATEDRIDADLALGRSCDLVAEIEELVAAHPFRERLRGQLMLALYRAGRQANALTAFQAARQTLVEELGIEPGQALRDLEQAILRQDRSLDAEGLDPKADDREPAPAANWLPRERRTVTVLYVDLAASDEPSADPEALRCVVARSLDVATAVLRRHGARVEELVGNLLVGFFGLPVAHEDDAVRAVRAAFELRTAIAALNDDVPAVAGMQFSARAGVETGELVVGTGSSLHARASGQALTHAARLQQAAADGDVLVGPATQRLVRGAAILKAVESIEAWHVLDVVPGAPAIARRLDAPMVGRAAELTRLRTAFTSTARRRTAYRLTVLGEAGIGKSRLSRAFAESMGSDVRIITGRCPAYGDGITFLPLREAVLEAAGPRGWAAIPELLKDEDGGAQIADHIAGAIGLTSQPGRSEELFPAVRRLLEILTAGDPLVVAIEDLHWAEPTFLDLIDYLADHTLGPVFLLCLARPDLIEKRPLWGAGKPNADALFLEPLDANDVEQLIAERAGAPLPPGILARIVEAADGNPLFAEQLLAAYDDHDLETTPASVQSLLVMRLDRLGPGERDLLRSAAVVGTNFTRDALSALIPDRARSFLDRHLQTLEHKRLIARGMVTKFRFAHALIHQAAYQSMTRHDRARLHQRFADWLEKEAPHPPPELDEIAGYHLEQAIEQLRAIGQVDTIPALAVRAGERLTSAGERAFGRFDITAAENLLSRARSLLPPENPRRARVSRVLAEAYQVLGRHSPADELLAELMDDARAVGDRSSERAIRLERARIQIFTGPDPIPLESLGQEAGEAARFFAEAGDDGGVARASFALGYVHMRAGRIGAMEDALRTSLVHANRSGQVREQLAAQWVLAHAIRLGATPVRDCIDACRELVAVGEMEHAGVLTELAILSAMLGEFEEARELNERARRLFVERMRVRRPLMFLANSNAAVELLAGDLATADRELRTAVDLALEIGERDEISRNAARLSFVLRAEKRSVAAAHFASLSTRTAPSEGVEAQALSRMARAQGLTERGDHRAAEALARQAVDLAPSKMLTLRADLLVELAEVLRPADGQRAAREALDEAARLYEHKGNIVAAGRVTRSAGTDPSPIRLPKAGDHNGLHKRAE
jgi:DNA-binding SARP family transcriptional activator/tetratricopeptide (TPR) repeat protein